MLTYSMRQADGDGGAAVPPELPGDVYVAVVEREQTESKVSLGFRV